MRIRPCRFEVAYTPNVEIDPIRNMLAELLVVSINDYYGPIRGDRSRLNKQEAKNFFFRPIDYELEFSFGWVCLHLFEHYESVITKIRAWLRRDDQGDKKKLQTLCRQHYGAYYGSTGKKRKKR